MLTRPAAVLVLVLGACDSPGASDGGRVTCEIAYREACESAFTGHCTRFDLDGYETLDACIAGMTEPPRLGDEVGPYGTGRYGCRWMLPETDLTLCYQLTAHQTCADFDAEVEWSMDFAEHCVAGFVAH